MQAPQHSGDTPQINVPPQSAPVLIVPHVESAPGVVLSALKVVAVVDFYQGRP